MSVSIAVTFKWTAASDFRIPACKKKNGNFSFSRVRSLVCELMDEALVRLGRQIGNRRLVIDAEHQMGIRPLFGNGEARNEERDSCSGLASFSGMENEKTRVAIGGADLPSMMASRPLNVAV